MRVLCVCLCAFACFSQTGVNAPRTLLSCEVSIGHAAGERARDARGQLHGCEMKTSHQTQIMRAPPSEPREELNRLHPCKWRHVCQPAAPLTTALRDKSRGSRILFRKSRARNQIRKICVMDENRRLKGAAAAHARTNKLFCVQQQATRDRYK